MSNQPLPGLCQPRVIKIFVAYDRTEAGVRAETLCAELDTADDFAFEIQPWRFNPHAAGDLNVRNASRHADILVLAWATPDGPPAPIFDWVLDWAVQRAVPNATLAALPVGDALAGVAAAPILHRLRQLASASNLIFVCDWTEGLSPHATDFSTALHQREQQLTPTLIGILEERHTEPHLDWGLNE
jgi:hypothetical protein